MTQSSVFLTLSSMNQHCYDIQSPSFTLWFSLGMHSVGLDKCKVTCTQYFHGPKNPEGTIVGLPVKKELEPMDDIYEEVHFISLKGKASKMTF